MLKGCSGADVTGMEGEGRSSQQGHAKSILTWMGDECRGARGEQESYFE